jgi:glycogen synthase
VSDRGADRSRYVPPTSRRLRALMVTFRYLPFTGGVELHVAQVARRLAARGIDMTILTTDATGSLPANEALDGLEVRRVRAWPANRDYYFAPRVYNEVARGDWDIVHVQSYHTFVGPLAMLAAQRSGIPYVVTFHGGGLAILSTWRSTLSSLVNHNEASASERFRHAVRPIQLSLLRPLLAGADRLIALAPFELEHYASRLRVPHERIVLIPNGSDLPRTDVSVERPRGAVVASLGRLERAKGHHRVLAALPHMVRRRPETRLWIAGAGPYESTLRSLVSSLDVSDHVEIRAVPPDNRAGMAKELARVKVAVLMSEFETQPIIALEALALGCRLIVADTPGLSALAEEGFARAVPLETSPDDLARAVIEELDKLPPPEPPRLPTWDETADSLLELYRSVVHSGG